MESVKNMLSILVIILCIGIIVAVVWYCLFGLRDVNEMMEGTLVKGFDMVRKMRCL